MRLPTTFSAVFFVAVLGPQAAVADRSGEADRILDQLTAAKGDRAARLGLIDELVGLAPTPTKALSEFLERKRKSSVDARRELLRSIGAAVPNEKGSFRDPGKEKKTSQAEADKFDWADKLADKRASAEVGDALADIAVVRALARSDDPSGALIALNFGFSPGGTIYRDEVGRYLRRGKPLSVPGLIRGRHDDRKDVRRYAAYQLERIDREAPHKAMRAARNNEVLAVSILEAYAETLHREAVYVILDHTDHPSLTLRAAARKAWNEFVTRKPKRPAPRRRLTLPGGEFTKTSAQLYYDHQELAEVELRKRVEAVTGNAPEQDVALGELTQLLYSALDERRAGGAAAQYDAARKAFAEQDFAAAAKGFDRVLALDPSFANKSEMAAAFLAHGNALLGEKNYTEAAAALRKAHALDPEGPTAKEALATSHVARARVIEAAGGDSAAELAKAREVDPNAGQGSGHTWMMFLGIGAALAGLLLLVAGALIRRR